MPRTVSPEQLQAAKELRDGGATWQSVHEQTGLALPTLYKYLGPSAGKTDPTPGGKGKKKTAKRQSLATDDQLSEFFGKAATLPAIPMAFYCDYCSAHFAKTGPGAAQQLVVLSKDHPALRSVMDMIYRYWQEAAWAALLGMYFGVPVMHHVAPDWIYQRAAWFMNMPPRGQPAPTHTHERSNGNGSTPKPEPAPQGAQGNIFGGMDIDSLMRMGEAMGFTFEPPTIPEDAPDTTEAADAPTDTESAGTDAPAQTETPAPDSDTSE